MDLIAHRAGNSVETAQLAVQVANIIEADVHLFRGRLELRHAKVLWPFAKRWEKWEFLPSDNERPTLDEIIDGLSADTHLWIDLKGFSGRLSRRVVQTVGNRRPLTASSRAWWILRPIRRAGGVRTMRSVGSRWQLWAIQRIRSWTAEDGIAINERFLTPEVAARLRALTPTIVAWNVNDIVRALELVERGVTGLIIDDLDLITEIDRALDGP